jgi:hypothetical protein
MAATASARTVYDAGKALRQNFQNNATPANPYTDENGGQWCYSSAAGVAPYTNLGNFKASYSTTDNGQLQGWGGTSSPHLKVNVTGHSLTSSDFMVGDCEPIEADEMVFHPGQTDNTCMVLRFAAPEDGWYSAFASFHDTSKETTATASSGASVAITLGANDVLARGIVSLEGVSGSTKRFDFQMPARYMTAGTEIRFAVNNNAGSSGTAHANDATGVKVFVVKEDEGAFYDSGIAMKNNVAASPYANPYGTIADGMWYFLSATALAAQTAPANVSLAATSRITTEATSTYLSGVARTSGGSSPFVLVNTSSSVQDTSVAPGELKVHPYAGDSTLKTWTVVRFRPPQSGRYSASIVVRDVDRANLSTYPAADGVDVYLYVSDTLVTNAYISLETAVACTAHFTFDDRFLVAGEPVDIVVSPHGEVHNDATGVSAIFRRENGNVYDSGKSFYADHAGGSLTDYFADLLGGGAMWQLGAKTNAWCGSQFYNELTVGQVAGGAKTMWWMQGRFTSYSEYPYFVMATNGTATADSTFAASSDLLAAAPQEFVAIVNEPGYQSSSPTLKATVPSDGVYRARAYARDLNNGGGDGVQASVVANGHVAATSPVMRDSGGTIYETALGADRLWLKGGDRIEYVVDPLTNRTSDPTGLSACYEICDASPSARVINIDFGVPSSVAGRFSNHTGAGREGWDDWNKWNALRISNSTPASSVSVDNCREADGETKRNVTLTLARTSGNVTKGYTSGTMPTGSALHNNWAVSSNASDTYTFTLSKLKANESYTLYLYSAKGGAAGNASFTVGGVAKTPDETWNLRDTKVLARFDVASDANGQITGTFAAADANGGAFNGLTLVGEFPEYDPPGMIIILR